MENNELKLKDLKAQAFDVRAQADYLNLVYQDLVAQINELSQQMSAKDQADSKSETK